ncbi:MAG: hypothetical protein JWR12_2617 [Mucilaginibacter sp.]|nr:hypothetical protein [Mucilaginibacter sp.]
MKIKYCFVIVLLFTTTLLKAQSTLKGKVIDGASNAGLSNVFIRDNTAKQYTLTDKQGNFAINTETGHLLVFESPGYMPDTLYVIDMTSKRIKLEAQSISLREVNINASKAAFDPHKEYPDVYTKSKVYVMSPSTWFSKEGKDARRLKRYFQYEAEERHVDAVFSRVYVSSIIPLKGKDLDDFMMLYRPSYAFLRDNNGPSLVTYINDSYKKFQALPPDKRTLPRLTSQ